MLPLISYIVIAAVIALIGRPVVCFFRQKLKLTPTLAVVVTMLLFVLLNLGFVGMFIPLLIAQGKSLSLLDIQALKSNVDRIIQETFSFFDITYHSGILDISKIVNIGDLPNFINSLIGFLGNFGIGFFSVLFVSFFFLKDGNRITEGILDLIPDKSIQNTRNSLNAIKSLLSRYFVGLTIQIGILFVIYTTILLIFGVKNAIVIAVLCAFLNLIPYLGPIIGFFVMTILTMTGNIDADFATEILPKTIYVGIGFLFAQLIDNFVNQPLIFSNSVKSHPLEIFIIILCGGYVFGIVGMIIAIPVYTVIKVILKEFMSDNAFVQSLTKKL